MSPKVQAIMDEVDRLTVEEREEFDAMLARLRRERMKSMLEAARGAFRDAGGTQAEIDRVCDEVRSGKSSV